MKNPNELSATSSWRGNELQLIEQKANIVVGVANSRTRLRIGVLLSKYSEYQVDYISSESETGKLIEEADLIIGAGITAYEGVLRRKPVIVVGDYGFGGLVTPDTFRKHYNNRFRDIPKIIKFKATNSLRVSCLFCSFKHSPQKTV